MRQSTGWIALFMAGVLAIAGAAAAADEGTQQTVIVILDTRATDEALDELDEEVGRIIEKIAEEGLYDELANDLANLIGGKHDLFLTLPSLLGFAMTYWMDTLTQIDDNVDDAVAEMEESSDKWQRAISLLREAQHEARTMKRFIRDGGGSEQAVSTCSVLIDCLQLAQQETVDIVRCHGCLGMGTIEGLHALAEQIHDLKDQLIDELPDVDAGGGPMRPVSIRQLYDSYRDMNAWLAIGVIAAVDESTTGVVAALLEFERLKHSFAEALNME